MKSLVKACLVLAALTACGTAYAAGGATPWTEMPETRVRLLASQTAVGDAASVELGLEIELAPGWKTYWRSPGESGAPPRFDWSGSENLAEVGIAWPAPHSFEAFDLWSHGYVDRVILPIAARPAVPGQAMMARLALDYQVCREICIPVYAEFSLTLPAGPAASTPQAVEIERYRRQVPRPNGEAGILIEPPQLLADDAGRALLVTVNTPARPGAPELLVEDGQRLSFGRPQRLAGETTKQARFRISVGSRIADEALAGRELTLTYIDGAEAREARLVVGR